MPTADLTLVQLAGSLPPSGALMGLDLGTKTIGVAVVTSIGFSTRTCSPCLAAAIP